MSESTNQSPEHIWHRPVPVIGDATSSAERDGDAAGWAFDDATRAALDRVIGARRDIRRYRPDDVGDELVRAVIEAGHGGPSVGQSQPWRFIVVRDRRTRERVALMADRERLRQAAGLAPERASRLLDLQLEGIREAPLGLVVACDRRTPASGVLGRNTFQDADLWSCAAAIENMWLTARAAGLGMGWVTLMRPAELAGLLRLPAGVETLGWLCLGWPDERPPFPGLERRAWSHKLPLDEVIMTDRWPEHAPQPPASGLPGTAPPGCAAPVGAPGP
ncbi:5,6-dimethylbenzimidazole synthase, partial [uncultured Propionibacterium sp.]|uniref:5,6-dimethylbenzimidazole synthase n=1 Tax=uncultured Propionibacterium sp. TaxID=218066 RepID=UPI00292E721C